MRDWEKTSVLAKNDKGKTRSYEVPLQTNMKRNIIEKDINRQFIGWQSQALTKIGEVPNLA